MKKLLFAMMSFATIILIIMASAETSQQQAGILCQPYGFDSETVQVSGPLGCEGDYWICGFSFYGNSQNVMIAVSRADGSVLSKDSDVFEDLAATKFASENSNSYLFNSFLNDPSFAIELNGMNSTLSNYQKLINSFKDDGTLTASQASNLRVMIDDLKLKSAELADDVSRLYNLSSKFTESPDCVELMDYIDGLEDALLIAENFSTSWLGFIDEYNSIASDVNDPRMASINPSDAQIMKQSVAAVGPQISAYREEEAEFITLSKGNLVTRMDYEDTKEKLQQAYPIVEDANNPNATAKYNEALVAFSKGEYLKTRSLITEAVALASINVNNGDTPPIIIESPPDYTPYFVLVGVLLFAIILLILRNRKPSDEENEDRTEDRTAGRTGDRRPKTAKKHTWSWAKEKENSMEKKASRLS